MGKERERTGSRYEDLVLGVTDKSYGTGFRFESKNKWYEMDANGHAQFLYTREGGAAKRKTEIAARVKIYNEKNREYTKLTKDTTYDPLVNYRGSLDDIQGLIDGLDEKIAYAKENAIPDAPVYEFAKTEAMQTLEDIINQTIATKPEFNPETATQWEGKINEAYAPVEANLERRQREQWASRFGGDGTGTGFQARKDFETWGALSGEKAGKALSFAENEYNKKWQDYLSSQGKAFDIQQFYDDAKRFTSDQERDDYWTKIQRGWGKSDIADQRMYERMNQDRDRQFYEDLAQRMQPKEKSWWEYALPLAGQLGAAALTGGMSIPLQAGLTGAQYSYDWWNKNNFGQIPNNQYAPY